LNLKVEQSIYRVIQESLANVARHSQARRVEIELTYQPDRLQFYVADNGRGFDVNRKLPGMGLRTMRERIQSVGGKLTIESEIGKGTRVSAQVPLSQEGIHEEGHLHSHR
jgi:signal transduction histidine kinase